MSHLIIEQGREVGREIAVPPKGMKFGRSPANDLVLDDPSTMLFHGRFFFKSDGTLWVTDFGAGDKTTVGGTPIDEYQLRMGDLVEVGSTAFRVVSTAREPEAAVPSAGVIDLGFKGAAAPAAAVAGSPKAHPRNSLMHRLMQIAVILLVLLVLVLVIPEMLKIAKPDAPAIPQKETLSLAYERVQADTANIFRYFLTLDQKGMLEISIFDLKGNRRFNNSKPLAEPLMLQLSASIKDTGFFGVGSDYAGQSEGRYDLYDITVQRNRGFHHIKVLNYSPVPSEIKQTAKLLEDFAFSELDVPMTFKWPEADLIRFAEEAFDRAEARFAERDVRYGNLAEAIQHYKEAMLYLETLDSKPELFKKATEGFQKAKAEQDRRYEEFVFRADKARKLESWQEAVKYYRILAELIPDRSDERYEQIRSNLLSAEQRIR